MVLVEPVLGCKNIFPRAPFLAHDPANSSQNPRVRGVFSALSKLDTSTGWKQVSCSEKHKELGNQGIHQRPTVCTACIIQINLHLLLTHVWENKIRRNLSQTRLTISQRKWYLNILAGLVKLCQLSQLTFLCYSTTGKEHQEVMINNGTSRTMLTKRCLRARGTVAAHSRGTCGRGCFQTIISPTGSIPDSLWSLWS